MQPHVALQWVKSAACQGPEVVRCPLLSPLVLSDGPVLKQNTLMYRLGGESCNIGPTVKVSIT